ncbi:hypothetical protein COO60DRAFT_282890 [Scenedesmus sp. NREL 46B-D3]|nr:hypothetical protein COO60DRAFT_282890 [Scenedesmus sp. NREL 46B-D3]
MYKQRQDPLCMHEVRLLAPLLRHPSISKDQQVVAALQQTSKELQEAVSARLAGQLPVVLHANKLQQVLPAAQLTQLSAEVDFSSSASSQAVAALTSLRHLELANTAAATATPADALMPLAAGLQQLTQLRIGPVGPAQLRQLPPKLQQLHITVDLRYSSQQLMRLTG